MRGFIFGLFLVPLLLVALLSIRPGGLRHQLHNVARRFRLVLVLGGIYFLGSFLIRVTLGPSSTYTDYAIGGLALVLAAIFFIRGQDPPREPSASSAGGRTPPPGPSGA